MDRPSPSPGPPLASVVHTLLRDQLAPVEYDLQETRRALDDLVGRCDVAFACKTELAESERRLNADVAACRCDIEQGLYELRLATAAKSDMYLMKGVQGAHDVRLWSFEDSLSEVKKAQELLWGSLKGLEQSGEEKYAKQMEQQQFADKVCGELLKTTSELSERLTAELSLKATRAQMRETNGAMKLALEETQKVVNEHTIGLEETIAAVAAWQELCNQNLATKIEMEEVTERVALEFMKKDEAREQLAYLALSLDTMNGELQGAVRQAQRCHKDLGAAQSDILELGVKTDKSAKRYDAHASWLHTLEAREASHREASEAWSRNHIQGLQDLQITHKAHLEEFRSHKAFQKAEGEKLKNHSTQRYLEQMEKALHLNDSLNRCIKKDDVADFHEGMRNVKLPGLVAGRSSPSGGGLTARSEQSF